MKSPSRYEIESQLFGIIKTLEIIHKKAEAGEYNPSVYRSTVIKYTNQLQHLNTILSTKGLHLNEVIKEMKLDSTLKPIIAWIKRSVLDKNIVLNKSNSKIYSEIPKNKKKNAIHEYSKMRVANANGYPHHEKEGSNDNRNIGGLNNNGGSNNNYSYNYKNGRNKDSEVKFPGFSKKTYENSLNSPYNVKNALFSEINPRKITVNPIFPAKLASEITADFITILDFFQLGLPKMELLRDQFFGLYEHLSLFPGMQEIAVDLSLVLKALFNNESKKLNIHNSQNKNNPIKIEDLGNLKEYMEQLYLNFKYTLLKMSDRD